MLVVLRRKYCRWLHTSEKCRRYLSCDALTSYLLELALVPTGCHHCPTLRHYVESWTFCGHFRKLCVGSWIICGHFRKLYVESWTFSGHFRKLCVESWTFCGHFRKLCVGSWTFSGHFQKLYAENWTSCGHFRKLYVENWTFGGHIRKIYCLLVHVPHLVHNCRHISGV